MAGNNGRWVLLYEKITSWEWYGDLPTKAVFLHLLLTVNWEDTVWREIKLQRGQRIISYSGLAAECRLSIQQVRTALAHLETTGTLTRSKIGKFSIVELTNYDIYQPTNTICNSKITANQQEPQHQINNRLNNYNNSRIQELHECKSADAPAQPPEKKKSSCFVPPTVDEVRAYCAENSYRVDAERFIDYYTSIGWKVGGKSPMKDWRATVRNWAKRDNGGRKQDAILDEGHDLDFIFGGN